MGYFPFIFIIESPDFPQKRKKQKNVCLLGGPISPNSFERRDHKLKEFILGWVAYQHMAYHALILSKFGPFIVNYFVCLFVRMGRPNKQAPILQRVCLFVRPPHPNKQTNKHVQILKKNGDQ